MLIEDQETYKLGRNGGEGASIKSKRGGVTHNRHRVEAQEGPGKNTSIPKLVSGGV